MPAGETTTCPSPLVPGAGGLVAPAVPVDAVEPANGLSAAAGKSSGIGFRQAETAARPRSTAQVAQLGTNNDRRALVR